VREMRSQGAVEPCPSKGAENCHEHHSDTVANQRKERSGAGACQSPANSEQKTAGTVADPRLTCGLFLSFRHTLGMAINAFDEVDVVETFGELECGVHFLHIQPAIR